MSKLEAYEPHFQEDKSSSFIGKDSNNSRVNEKSDSLLEGESVRSRNT